MKKLISSVLIALIIGVMVVVGLSQSYAEWPGVDEAVVKKFAEQAGRPPREPYINTTQGDMLLFCFLTAGAIGGFVVGYYFRALFPPKSNTVGN